MSEVESKLQKMLRQACEEYKHMTPEEREALHRKQARSYARAEAGFGSDADEAEYRAALESGDPKRIAAVKRKETERLRAMGGE